MHWINQGASMLNTFFFGSFIWAWSIFKQCKKKDWAEKEGGGGADVPAIVIGN